MGHDIFGYRKVKAAYLRRSMNSESIHKLYTILGIEEYDAGVSGNGEFVSVEQETILAAIETVKNDSELDQRDRKDYLAFLEALKELSIDSDYGEIILRPA
jgi:hypothetical protein